MKCKIIHETEYTFTSDVFLEPHYLRFEPQKTPYQSIEEFKLEILPQPAGITNLTDEDGNLVYFCWFDGTTKFLRIKAESITELQPYNPFNFIIHPMDCQKVPFEYPKGICERLKNALAYKSFSIELTKYTEGILEKSGSQTIDFIVELTRQIHSDFVVESRLEGPPHLPSETFRLKKGSCRDLAWMELAMFRSLGIATRFTSGYYFFDAENPEFELHAWVEVYLPGAGWVGLDPSHGMVTGNSHIKVASSTDFENTMPVTGTVRGKAKGNLETNVHIETFLK
ncbi:MAG: transglutaminase family protein [Cyclobacteriaceae bacterium]|nr:transglutaminase family protein [Cyclobacteriaceae bacterium]